MQKKGSTTTPALLIAWPGADWETIIPMIDDGLLPNLSQLIDNGAIGKLLSVQPSNCASVWTSAVTGKYPHQHGIVNELEPNPAAKIPFKPVSCFSRSSKAIWNILHQNDHPSLVVGWPATHPAEPVKGAVVSPRFTDLLKSSAKSWSMLANAVFPAELGESISQIRVHPSEINGVNLAAFVPKLHELENAQDVRLSRLAQYVAEAASIQAAITQLMETKSWDFASVFFSSFSNISRDFINYKAPQMPFVSDDDFELFQHVIKANYAFHDMMLGRLIELAGQDATIVLVSDEGTHGGELRSKDPQERQPEYIEPGLLVIRGPDIKQDHLIYGASILDILPTILQIFNLPVGQDMDGKVLHEVFRSTAHTSFIKSYEALVGDDGRHADADYSTSAVERFLSLNQALHVADVPDLDHPDIVGVQSRNFLYNMAESLMAAHREGEAIAILKYLTAADPAESKFYYKLMNCYIAINLPGLALQSVDQMLACRKLYAAKALKTWKQLDAREDATLSGQELAWKTRLWKKSRINLAGITFLRALALYANNEYEDALQCANRADATLVHNPSALLRLRADCLTKIGRLHETPAVYQQMLTIHSGDFHADVGLARVSYELKKYEDAVIHAANAIGKRYFNPQAHFIYGGAIFRCGKPNEAAQALHIAVAQDPSLVGAHQRLMLLYGGVLRCPDKEKYHKEKLRQLESDNEAILQRRKDGYDKALI